LGIGIFNPANPRQYGITSFLYFQFENEGNKTPPINKFDPEWS
jgi:hypothetical protein